MRKMARSAELNDGESCSTTEKGEVHDDIQDEKEEEKEEENSSPDIEDQVTTSIPIQQIAEYDIVDNRQERQQEEDGQVRFAQTITAECQPQRPRRRTPITSYVSSLARRFSVTPVRATLVEDDQVIVAERVNPYREHKWRYISGATACLLIIVGIIALSLGLTETLHLGHNEGSESTSEELMAPTQAPTHDPRPTLEIIQERGVLRCGLRQVRAYGDFYKTLVSSISPHSSCCSPVNANQKTFVILYPV